jgi:AraC family transcriptional regulator, transcriptional activator of pobA
LVLQDDPPDKMTNKKKLKYFHFLEHLKRQFPDGFNAPYFLASHESYQQAGIDFPFRSFCYGIGLTYSGNCLCKIGSNEYQLQDGSLITIGPGIVSQWSRNYGSTSDTIFFTEELFKTTLKSSFLSSLRFFSPGGNHVITITGSHFKKISLLFQTLKEFKDEPDVIAGIIYSLLMLVIKAHNIMLGHNHNSLSTNEKITSDFKSLVSKHFLDKRDVNFYATQINISPKYLSEVLVMETGKSAKRIIDDIIFLEANSLLKQTNMSVKEICGWLGYADTSYFNKAFKKREGITPLAYRKK